MVKTTKKTIIPPIKSQGIKTKLLPWINDLVECSKVNKKTSTWIEPFFGTGVVGFNSGFKNVIAGDTNPHIINFYSKIQDKTITHAGMKAYLLDANDKLSNAEDNGYVYYKEVRDRFNKEFSPYDFIFLSRAGFNGMMRFNRKGQWNIPFCKKPDRFQQAYVTKIINQVKNIQSVITETWDFCNVGFDDTILKAKEADLIYCDPPYYGRYVDYYNGWTEKDEENLFNLLSATKAKFILSTWHHNAHRKNEMIDKFWDKFNIVTKNHFYHSGGKIENRQAVVEALICNFDLDEFAMNDSPTDQNIQLELF